jgi:hypothetical protein
VCDYYFIEDDFCKNLICPRPASHNLGPSWASNVIALKTLHSAKIYIYSCLCEFFDLSSKAGSLWG